jgi:hydrogenase/urease accessory protein HupE
MRRTGTLALACLIALAAAPAALAHSDPIVVPQGETGAGLALEFGKYGAKHIVLGYDHVLFLLGLAVLCTRLRDVATLAALFFASYSATLIGATVAGVAVPGDLVDGVIALSVAFVGAQIAFGTDSGEAGDGAKGARLGRDPRPAALVFGLAHGLGLSSLLQELRLPGDDLLPSVLGFNAGVEVGQVAVLLVFVLALRALRAFPFPARQRVPAGFALISAATVFLSFLVTGVSL